VSWSLALIFAAAVATPSPPAVTLQAIAERSRLETRDPIFGRATVDRLPVTIVISNNSDSELRLIELLELSEVFRVDEVAALPPLPPRGSYERRIFLRPKENAGYGAHEALLLLRYRWMAGAEPRVSTLTAVVKAEIKRPFEDEASGLPGGTAALLSLLLPLFPAFFAYQLVDRWRKGEGFRMPSFGSEYIFPAFFIALLGTSLGLILSRRAVFLGALAVGILWPLLRWLGEYVQRKRWAFSEADSDVDYLRKALLGPRAPRRFARVNGVLLGETWKGVRLLQPDGDLVLGAELQVTPTTEDYRPKLKKLVDSINGGGGRSERKQLLEHVRTKACTLARRQNVEQGSGNWRPVVAIGDVVGLKEELVERVKLLTLTT
jgi:hypothetical protein